MKVLILNGSPRKGNTCVAVNALQKGMLQADLKLWKSRQMTCQYPDVSHAWRVSVTETASLKMIQMM